MSDIKKRDLILQSQELSVMYHDMLDWNSITMESITSTAREFFKYLKDKDAGYGAKSLELAIKIELYLSITPSTIKGIIDRGNYLYNQANK